MKDERRVVVCGCVMNGKTKVRVEEGGVVVCTYVVDVRVNGRDRK